MTFAIKNIQCNYLSHIDADLSVSIDEITNLANILSSENKQFIFGSRWKRISSKTNLDIDKCIKRLLDSKKYLQTKKINTFITNFL